MNRDEILNLSVGKELDKLATKLIMKWDFFIDHDDQVFARRDFNERGFVFKPSTDISAAWQIVEKMQIEHELVWNVWKMSVHDVEASFGRKPSAYGKTAPEAICKAALLALAHEKE